MQRQMMWRRCAATPEACKRTRLPVSHGAEAAQGCRLQHARPGTLSLAISENDDDQAVKLRNGYRNTTFLITTGGCRLPALLARTRPSQAIGVGSCLAGLRSPAFLAGLPRASQCKAVLPDSG